MKITMSLGTYHPEILVRIWIALDPPESSVLDVSEYATTVATPVAERWNTGYRCLGTGVDPLIKVEQAIAQGKRTYGRSRHLDESPSRYLTILQTHCHLIFLYGYQLLH
jgi:hypothetical protein